MANLFISSDLEEVLLRINQLTSESKPLWGVMTVGQMLKHAQGPVDFASGRLTVKVRWFYRILPLAFFRSYLIGKPYEKSLPTQKAFLVTGNHDFETEKAVLLKKLRGLVNSGPQRLENARHPVYGKLSADEWSYLQWKHLDHHLRQFGV
jgi:hypothetical protein